MSKPDLQSAMQAQEIKVGSQSEVAPAPKIDLASAVPVTSPEEGQKRIAVEEFFPEDFQQEPKDYGLRKDGTPKGKGFLGELKRPDGKVSTELSIGVDFDGKETEIPSLVPTLTQEEVDYLLEGNEPTPEIVQKAVDHAKGRMSEGKSPFADEEEAQQVDEETLNTLALRDKVQKAYANAGMAVPYDTRRRWWLKEMEELETDPDLGDDSVGKMMSFYLGENKGLREDFDNAIKRRKFRQIVEPYVEEATLQATALNMALNTKLLDMSDYARKGLRNALRNIITPIGARALIPFSEKEIALERNIPFQTRVDIAVSTGLIATGNIPALVHYVAYRIAITGLEAIPKITDVKAVKKWIKENIPESGEVPIFSGGYTPPDPRYVRKAKPQEEFKTFVDVTEQAIKFVLAIKAGRFVGGKYLQAQHYIDNKLVPKAHVEMIKQDVNARMSEYFRDKGYPITAEQNKMMDAFAEKYAMHIYKQSIVKGVSKEMASRIQMHIFREEAKSFFIRIRNALRSKSGETIMFNPSEWKKASNIFKKFKLSPEIIAEVKAGNLKVLPPEVITAIENAIPKLKNREVKQPIVHDREKILEVLGKAEKKGMAIDPTSEGYPFRGFLPKGLSVVFIGIENWASHEDIAVELGFRDMRDMVEKGYIRFDGGDSEMRFETGYPAEHIRDIRSYLQELTDPETNPNEYDDYLDATVIVESEGQHFTMAIEEVLDNPQKFEAQMNGLHRKTRGVEAQVDYLGDGSESIGKIEGEIPAKITKTQIDQDYRDWSIAGESISNANKKKILDSKDVDEAVRRIRELESDLATDAYGEGSEYLQCDECASLLSGYLWDKGIPHYYVIGKSDEGSSHAFIVVEGRVYDPTDQGFHPSYPETGEYDFATLNNPQPRAMQVEQPDGEVDINEIIKSKISAKEVEDMAERFVRMTDGFEDYYPEYPSSKEWIAKEDPHQVALELESNYSIYQRYFERFAKYEYPNEIMPVDIIKAYQAGVLQQKIEKPKLDLKPTAEDIPAEERADFWSPKKMSLKDPNKRVGEEGDTEDGDISFPFGANEQEISEVHLPKNKAKLTSARKRLEEIQDKEQQLEAVRTALAGVDAVAQEYQKSIKVRRSDADNYGVVPKYFRGGKYSNTLDLEVTRYNEMNGTDLSEGEFVDWLQAIDNSRKELRDKLSYLRKDVTKKVGEKASLKKIVKKEEELEEAKLQAKAQKLADEINFGKKEAKAKRERREADLKKKLEKEKKALADKTKKLAKLDLPSDYNDRIEALLEEYDLGNRTEKTKLSREKRKKYLGELEDLVDISLLGKGFFRGIGKTTLDEMTLGEIQHLNDQIDALVHAGKTKARLLLNKKVREEAQVAKNINDKIAKKTGYVPEKLEEGELLIANSDKKSMGEQYKQIFRNLFATSRKVEFITDKLEISEYIVDPIMSSSDKERKLNEFLQDKSKEIFKPVRNKMGKWDKPNPLKGVREYTDPKTKKTQALTLEQQIGVTLNTGNVDNIKRLLEGNKFSPEEIKIIRDYVMGIPEYNKLVNDIWNLLEDMRPYVAEAFESVTGVKFRAVDGRYFPILYDRTLSDFIRLAQDTDLMQSTLIHSADVRFGSVKERSGTGGALNLNFLEPLYFNLQKAIRYSAFAPEVKAVNAILQNKVVKNAITGSMNKETFDSMETWLKRVANPFSVQQGENAQAVNIFRYMATQFYLGANPSVSAVQALSFFLTVDELGVGRSVQGLLGFYFQPLLFKDMNKFIMEKSSFMRARYGRGNFDRDLRDISNTKWFKKLTRGKVELQRLFYAGITMIDYLTTMPSWLAGYYEGMSKFDGDIDKASAYADKVARKTQPTGDIENLATMMSGGAWQRLWTAFMSFTNTAYNRVADMWFDILKDKTTSVPKKTWNTLLHFWWVVLAPAYSYMYIKNKMKPEDEQKVLDSKAYMASIANTMAGGVPLLREITSAIAYGYSSGASPSALSFIKLLADVVLKEDKLKEAIYLTGYFTRTYPKFVADLIYDNLKEQDIPVTMEDIEKRYKQTQTKNDPLAEIEKRYKR